MLAPGLTISGGAVVMSDAAPDYAGNGVGWLNGGALAVTTAAYNPANAYHNGGLAFTQDVRLYVTTTQSSDDVYLSGLRISTNGQLVIQVIP
jgi:hypothetical protein